MYRTNLTVKVNIKLDNGRSALAKECQDIIYTCGVNMHYTYIYIYNYKYKRVLAEQKYRYHHLCANRDHRRSKYIHMCKL